jgi:ATP-dependent exoDNAse (exonuclease V) alpha subunit
MAIFRFSVKILSRRNGVDAVRITSYWHGVSIKNLLTGASTNKLKPRACLVFERIILPQDAPQWAVDKYLGEDVVEASGRLWNDIERREDQHNYKSVAQLASTYTISLPHELSRDFQIELIEGYSRDNLMANGEIIDIVVHDKGDGNPYAHIMSTLRGLEQDGFGKRIMAFTGKRMKLISLRSAWAVAANTSLEMAGFDERIDHRSNIDIEDDHLVED